MQAIVPVNAGAHRGVSASRPHEGVWHRRATGRGSH